MCIETPHFKTDRSVFWLKKVATWVATRHGTSSLGEHVLVNVGMQMLHHMMKEL